MESENMTAAQDCRRAFLVYLERTAGPSSPRAGKPDRTVRAVARRILREMYGNRGPVGVKDPDLLVFVNERLVKERRSQISLSTLLRARKEEFGW
jgi:hypothetical protein